MSNAVRTFNGVMEYQLWAAGPGAQAEILHVTDRGGQLVVTYRADEAGDPAGPAGPAVRDDGPGRVGPGRGSRAR